WTDAGGDAAVECAGPHGRSATDLHQSVWWQAAGSIPQSRLWYLTGVCSPELWFGGRGGQPGGRAHPSQWRFGIDPQCHPGGVARVRRCPHVFAPVHFRGADSDAAAPGESAVAVVAGGTVFCADGAGRTTLARTRAVTNHGAERYPCWRGQLVSVWRTDSRDLCGCALAQPPVRTELCPCGGPELSGCGAVIQDSGLAEPGKSAYDQHGQRQQ